MTDEAEKAYEAQIAAIKQAIRECHARGGSAIWLGEDSYESFARAAAEAIGLKPGCVVVPSTDLSSETLTAYWANLPSPYEIDTEDRAAASAHLRSAFRAAAAQTAVRDYCFPAPIPQAD